MFTSPKKVLILMIFVVLSYESSEAQFLGTPSEIVTAKAFTSQDQFHSGQNFKIAIQLNIQDGWHINANPAGQDNLIPTELILPKLPNLILGPTIYPKGEITNLVSVGKVPLYHYQSLIGVQGKISTEMELGSIKLMLTIRYQACNDQICLMPMQLSIPVSLTVVSSDRSMQPIHADIFEKINFKSFLENTKKQAASDNQFLSALSKGHFWAFLFVFVGGVLTSLTPCVYPLIPITVSVFGAGRDTSRRKSFFLSISYVFGMAVMYSLLGLVVAVTGSVFGAIMVNPIAIGLVCAI